MSMEDKVDYEVSWDSQYNAGKRLKGIVDIIISNGVETQPRPREELMEIATVLGNTAEARIVEWRDRAVASIAHKEA